MLQVSSCTFVKVVHWAVYTAAVVVSEGSLLVLLASCPEYSLLCAGNSNSGCAWYAEIRLIYKPSSVFVFPCI